MKYPKELPKVRSVPAETTGVQKLFNWCVLGCGGLFVCIAIVVGLIWARKVLF